MNINDNISKIREYFTSLQQTICHEFELHDNKKFIEDHWNYEIGNGGGLTKILENGNNIEKGGVNFSHISAKKLPKSIIKMKPELEDYSFQALGISLVIHPLNPMIPTTHMNIRFFIAEQQGKDPIWWFGGGFDLTPYYGFVEDCKHWHKEAYKACQPFGKNLYKKFKEQCDSYFYLPHRDEPRGIGGLFFDYFTDNNNFNNAFNFSQSVGNHFLNAYMPIFQRRKNTKYTNSQRDFQLYRRGRYVEFNLLFDRGTHFGIQSNGRIESIFMSLPPLTKWVYNYKPKTGSLEEELYSKFLIRKNWLNP